MSFALYRLRKPRPPAEALGDPASGSRAIACPGGLPGPRPAAQEPPQDFLAQWRHAMREPLNALMAAVAVLDSVPEGSEAARDARRVIARQARTLAWVISERPGDAPHQA